MTPIQLTTSIQAPIEKVFDLSRDIDFHCQSLSDTQETAIAGRTTGKIELNETVRWRGKHFGLYLTHESKITSFDFPNAFTDVMIAGHFKMFNHRHIFEKVGDATLMTDIIEYKVPYGIFGRLFDRLILRRHLTKLISNRNAHLKKSLES